MSKINEEILDLTTAIEIRKAIPPVLDRIGFIPDVDLSAYTQATPEALTFLANQGYPPFVYLGLKYLSNKNAHVLAGWAVFLVFTNLKKLEIEAARILVSGQSQLTFECQMDVSTNLAYELASLNNLLNLRLEQLSVEVATELAKHSHELYLDLITPPTELVMLALCEHMGYRLSVTWERRAGESPYKFSPQKNNKKVFVIPRLVKETGVWIENVYIGDSEFYPESPVTDDGIITLL